jgi:hypothetical protein
MGLRSGLAALSGVNGAEVGGLAAGPVKLDADAERALVDPLLENTVVEHLAAHPRRRSEQPADLLR